MTTKFSLTQMEERLVRYGDLKPCTTAFIDARTPGSDRKENFTIIGPGVAENPEQHVHITLRHGFNIGGARQPPGCVNSQHSHDTAEVFVIHTGTWRFKTGADGSDGHVDLEPGDTISIPVHTFRGFENVGQDIGFMFAILGGDDPGRVTWAPYVFDAAARHGIVLLESGRLIDTTQESIPAGAVPMPATTAADLSNFDRYNSDAIARCTVKASALTPSGGLSEFIGFEECPIVGCANPAEQVPAGPISWPHGFQVRALRIAPGARSPAHVREEEEVLLVHSGQSVLEWDGGAMTLGAGDTFTVPKCLARIFANPGDDVAVVYIVRGGDHPAAARIVQPLPRNR
jgi:mannose-6-phosphate isomerase-like protein (cupin superfamily)